MSSTHHTLTIHADGSIACGTTLVRARITGTSPRELITDLDPGYAGIATTPGLHVDVTRAWGAADLPAVVAALLNDAPLPAGYAMGQRRDGVAMVRVVR